MAEQQSAPAPAAAPAPAVESFDAKFESKMSSMLGLDAEPPTGAPAPEPQEAAEATPEGELAPDDLPPEEPAGEGLEISYKGETRRLSKEEAKKLAEKGIDYETRSQALAEERK